MSRVDVVVETVIDVPRDVVAAFAMNPDHAPRWYDNIKEVAWVTTPPLVVGSQVAFVARFLGRRLAYTYAFVDVVPGERLVMRTAEGPFPMETTYTFVDEGQGTRMTLQNRGEPRGFSTLMAPFMSTMMRRATTKDLARLKAVLEAR